MRTPYASIKSPSQSQAAKTQTHTLTPNTIRRMPSMSPSFYRFFSLALSRPFHSYADAMSRAKRSRKKRHCCRPFRAHIPYNTPHPVGMCAILRYSLNAIGIMMQRDIFDISWSFLQRERQIDNLST